MMQYREIEPHALLARHIRCYWILRDLELCDDRPPERIVPDGCMEIVFNLADLFSRRCGDAVQGGLRSYVVGAIDRHVITYPGRRVHLLGIRFRPDGLRPFMGMPMSQLAGSIIGLQELWGAHAGRFEERLMEARSAAEQINILDTALLCQLEHRSCNDTIVGGAIEAITRQHGQLRIAVLAGELGISERQLERRFHEAIGITPKALSRVARFQRIIRAVDRSRDARQWVQLALDAGYADQAHFINDFRAFAGESPTRFFAGYHQMSDNFSGLMPAEHMY